MATRDIYSRLKQDHEQVKKLITRLERKADEKTFDELAEQLEAHTWAEERVFYAPLQSQTKTHQMILEAKEEHHVVALLLRELKTNRKGTDVWNAKLTVLKETVEHHVKEEEGAVFKAAEKLISSEQARQMVRLFDEAKQPLAV